MSLCDLTRPRGAARSAPEYVECGMASDDRVCMRAIAIAFACAFVFESAGIEEYPSMGAIGRGGEVRLFFVEGGGKVALSRQVMSH